MNKEKRQKYVESLYAAIHTMNGRAEWANLCTIENEPIVKNCYPIKRRGQDDYYFHLLLNPNKAADPRKMIRRYSDFKKVLEEAMKRIEAEELQITRADMSFNSDNPNDYELFKKLNRLLICCIALACGVTNCYHASDLWNDQSLSIAIKSDTIEAENYNKELESGGAVDTTCRLELRSKRMSGNLEEEFMIKWFNRLDKAVLQYHAVQDRYNRELVKIWNTDQSRPEKERQFVSLSAFLMRYSDCIFSRKQLQSFLENIGVYNPKNYAKKFKEKHKIEFYSLTDLQYIVSGIKTATETYFKN